MSSLDDGVMKKPTKVFTGNRTGKSIDFYDMIAKGDNPIEQTTISPAEVTRAGCSVGYNQPRFGGKTEGNRWNSNPMMDCESNYSYSLPAIPKKKK